MLSQIALVDTLKQLINVISEDPNDYPDMSAYRQVMEAQKFAKEAIENIQPNSVWIAFGSPDQTGPIPYEFETPAELNAFLFGINEGCGWLDYIQFDSREEAYAYVQAKEKENAECQDT